MTHPTTATLNRATLVGRLDDLMMRLDQEGLATDAALVREAMDALADGVPARGAAAALPACHPGDCAATLPPPDGRGDQVHAPLRARPHPRVGARLEGPVARRGGVVVSRSRSPWAAPRIGDIVVTRASGDGHGPARRREITDLTERVVEYDDGRTYSKYIPGRGYVGEKGTSCAHSTWAHWCSKHAVEYWRAGEDLLARETATP